jgi:hypothetical protein
MSMEDAIAELLKTIIADYELFFDRSYKNSVKPTEIIDEQIAEFKARLRVEPGRKYIKIVQRDSVWGFIVATDDDKQFARGDILKAAGWAAPARNFARGNVLEGGYTVRWTGAA